MQRGRRMKMMVILYTLKIIMFIVEKKQFGPNGTEELMEELDVKWRGSFEEMENSADISVEKKTGHSYGCAETQSSY